MGVRHVEPDAVITHEDHDLIGRRSAVLTCSDLYSSGGHMARILEGIRQQVREHELQHARIAWDTRQVLNHPLDLARRIGRSGILDGVLHQTVQIDVAPEHLGAPHPREHEQGVDQLPHLPGALRDQPEVAFPRRFELDSR